MTKQEYYNFRRYITTRLSTLAIYLTDGTKFECGKDFTLKIGRPDSEGNVDVTAVMKDGYDNFIMHWRINSDGHTARYLGIEWEVHTNANVLPRLGFR